MYLATPLRLCPEVFMSNSARNIVLISLFRVCTYQFVVVACQQASGLLIAVLIAAEMSKSAYLCKTYSHLKHIKNISYLARNVSKYVLDSVFVSGLATAPQRQR